MKATSAYVGARGADCVTIISAEEAAKLKAAGIDFMCRYLPSLTAQEVTAITSAGMALMGVTYSARQGWVAKPGDGTAKGYAAVQEARLVGIPAGVVLWLDIEGAEGPSEGTVLFAQEFYAEVQKYGYVPGIYVGAEPNMSSTQLMALPFHHYWKGQSQLYHGGQLVEPRCGWQMVQLFPSIKVADTLVDVNFIQQDYMGRLPVWCVRD